MALATVYSEPDLPEPWDTYTLAYATPDPSTMFFEASYRAAINSVLWELIVEADYRADIDNTRRVEPLKCSRSEIRISKFQSSKFGFRFGPDSALCNI